MPELFFIGVDVGSTSARAGLFNSKGILLNRHTAPIHTWNTESDQYEQSSDDIWKAVCICVKVKGRNIQ